MCANRDPQTPPRDHTVAIIAGLVAVMALLVVLAIALEWTDSPNTLAIIGVLGVTIGVGVIAQVAQLSGIKRDTANIQHQLNGNLTAKFDAITESLERIDQRIDAIDGSIDSRARAAVTAVNANPERVEEFDRRMTHLVDKALDRREAMCKVPQPQRRRMGR